MKKIIGLFAAVAMVAMMAIPAAASPSAGVFAGTATVAKSGTCGSDGVLSGAGGGGLGILTNKPALKWGLSLGLVADAPRGAGTANLCGDLSPANVPAVGQVGASCISTHGSNGRGAVNFVAPAATVTVSNLGWDYAVGGTLVITGSTSEGGLTAVAQVVPGGAECATKDVDPNNKSGAQTFGVVAAYAIV